MKTILYALLIVACLIPCAPGAAQEDVLPLFASVQVPRVTVATAAVHNGANQREYVGVGAQATTQLVQQLSGQFVGADRIQRWTWDFKNWQPREYTPLVLLVSVREEWDMWEMRNGVDRLIHYMHRTTLSCYDVGDADVYDCRQSQGSVYFEMSYHFNSVCVNRADIERLIADLGM